MKILMVTHEYGDMGTGIANLVLNLKNNFEAKGHEVKVMSPIGPDYEVYPNPNEYKQGGLFILTFWDRVVNELKFHPFNDFDIIWFHSPLLSKPINDKRIIVTPHSTYNGRWKYLPTALYPNEILKNIYYKWMNYKEKQCYKNMTNLRWFTANKQLQKEIQNLGIKTSTIIPNGVSTNIYTLGTNKKEQCCAATRIVPWKRVDKLVEIFNRRKYKLKIAGSGPLLKKLKKKAKSNIEFLGRLNNEEMIKLYQESKGFVSTSEYEGFPLAPLEAMSCGCYPILSDIPSHNEMIKGLNTEDPKKLREYVKKNYDWSIIVDKYLEAFNDTTN